MVTPASWIVEATAKATGVSPADLRGRARHRFIVLRRKFCARKLEAEGYTLVEIGRALGNRHHTTIMHYLGRVVR